METTRKEKVFDFVVRHKTDCYRAFKLDTTYKGFNTDDGGKLIELARKEIEYSPRTWAGDIYRSLYRVYAAITIEGVNSPDEIKR